MTTEMCSSTCASKGFNVYALQYGSYCYCGTHESNYEALGIAPEGECRTHCAGAPTCGAETSTSVFEGEAYVGCYKHDSRANTFTFGGAVRDLTMRACLDRCSDAFRYIGIRQGNKCYCSDTLPSETYIVNNSKCLEEGSKCQGGDRCGGSGKIAVWTNIEILEEDGVEYVGCYKDTGFAFIQRNKHRADCAQLCRVDYLYVGISSDTVCFCGNMLPNEKRSVYKTMKLLYSSDGTAGSYRLEILCNDTNTGYLKVWRLGSRSCNDSCTMSPSEAANNEDSIPADITQDTNESVTTVLPNVDNEDAIPWLKVYPFLIASFFLGSITVILVVCLSRSYQSRRLMMQVRKQMAKQGKVNLTLITETSGNELAGNPNSIDRNTVYSTVNDVGNIQLYNIVACTDPVSIHHEEVQKKSAVSESASNRQYTKVDRQSVSSISASRSNPNEEDYYSVPTKPALPKNPPLKIMKQTKKKQIPKGKSKEGKGKTTSRPTYAPPGVHKIKAMTPSDGTGTTSPTYSFPTKSLGHKDQQSILAQGESPEEEQYDRVEFDFQPKNQIRFKKRSMFGENVTKSFILCQGSDLSSVYSFPNKTDKRPKSSSEVPVKRNDSLKITLDLPGKECNLEHISEIPSSKITEAYGGSNEDSFSNLVNEAPTETSPDQD